jgi:hypothetical protein
MRALRFFYRTDWAATSLDCISHTAMVMTRQYVESYTWQAIVVHDLTAYYSPLTARKIAFPSHTQKF